MLEATHQVDGSVMEGLRGQFKALDSTGSGIIGAADLPPGVGLKKTHIEYNGHVKQIRFVDLFGTDWFFCLRFQMHTEIDVVPLPGYVAPLGETPGQKHIVNHHDVNGGDGPTTIIQQAMARQEGDDPTSDDNDEDASCWRRNRKSISALLSIFVFIGFGGTYYSTHAGLGWTFGEVVYFTLVTILTVGYGDFNGSHDMPTMVFTMFYAFLGGEILALHYTNTR
jgi:hypothetical protein